MPLQCNISVRLLKKNYCDFHASHSQWDARKVPLMIILGILICLVIRLHLVFIFEINWDEFLNLSMVYSYLRGGVHEVFQTGFIHAFGWLRLTSVNEAEQIIYARLVMFLLGVFSSFMIYLIGRRLLGHVPALFALLCYLAFTFVVRNGNSFRTDTIAVFFIVSALCMIVCGGRSWRNSVIAGGLFGLAGVATIKSVFYAPVFIIIFISETCSRACRVYLARYVFIFIFSALITFSVLIALHAFSLESMDSPLRFLNRTIGKTIGERDFLHARHVFKQALLENPIFWGMLFSGLMASIISCFKVGFRQVEIINIGMALPLLSFFIYTESYPYYYPFVIASAAVLCGRAFLWVSTKSKALQIVLIGCLFFSIFLSYCRALQQRNTSQIEVINVVHKAFPLPVAYIDRCSMISSYPKVGIFMSRWGMTDYYKQGAPVIRQAIENYRPVFILANMDSLDIDSVNMAYKRRMAFRLLHDDFISLKSNYIHHWGPIYVAGKRLRVNELFPTKSFHVHIAGMYTLESSVSVLVDGKRVYAGEVFHLADGEHKVSLDRKPADIVLRWGENLYRPYKDFDRIDLFRGF